MSARKITDITWDEIERTCELLAQNQIWDSEFGTSAVLRRMPGRIPRSKAPEQGNSRNEGETDQVKPQ